MSTTSVEGIWASSIILPVLDLTVIGLRFYVRSNQSSSLKADDWLQIPAIIMFIGIAVSAMIGAANHAFGYPTPMDAPPTMPPTTLILAEKLWFVIQLVQIPCLAITKIAALLFYRRIFVTHKGPLEWIIWTLTFLTTLWCFAFMGFYLGVCGSHFDAAWSGWLGFAEYCITAEFFEQGYAISDFILDTFVLIVPLPAIWRLHTSTARKLGITGVFLFALIGYGASIARLVVFVKLAENSLTHAHDLPDIQTTDTQAAWFTNLEIGLALFALNLPSIWGLLSKASMSSLVQSVRSLISLPGSSHGNSTGRSGQKSGQHGFYRSNNSSHPPEISMKIPVSDPSDQSSMDVKLMPRPEHDVETGYGGHSVPGIVVERTVDLRESHVPRETRI